MKKLFLAAALLLSTAWGAFSQEMPVIPNDPAFRKGVLDNGMTYYIRHNAKPEKQAEFFIFDNVGAMQEEDNQQGLAHFLEHMAFNGTKNFPDKNLINWLESVGVKFGANLNAGTATEFTVYMMQNVPLTRESIVDSTLLVLHDWAYFITLDHSEIDKERGVIVEELRTGNTANRRAGEKSDKYIYGDTRYANRNVIGHEDGLKNFTYQDLEDFYHRWYRTDQQAIIIVGDFDVDMMEQKIKAVMADIPAVENPEPKQYVSIPDNEQPVVGIITDPELTSTDVDIYIKRAALPLEMNNTIIVSAMNTMDALASSIATERMRDITQKPDAPFVSGRISPGSGISTTTDAVSGSASARDGESLTAFRALYTEMEKIRRFGFTESELERAKTQMERQAQQTYDEREDRRNDEFVWAAIGNFMSNYPMPDAETNYELDKQLLSMIDVTTLNEFMKERFTDNNQVVIITMPEKEGVAIPTSAQVEEIIAEVRAAEIESTVEEVVIEPLIPATANLKGSKVNKTTADPFGSTIWTLKNGIKVVVHPTTLKADEVFVNISSGGGLSVLDNNEILTADVISNYMPQMGVGKFSATDLRKQLTGKVASLYPMVGAYSNGFNGSASPKDMETLMQLIYLNFTAPRFNEADFGVITDRMKASYGNMASNPMFKLQVEAMNTIFDGNPRRKAMMPEEIDQISFTQMQKIYRELYANPANFTFTFTGTIDLETFRPLVEKYLGSLPKSKAKLDWEDDGVRMAQGKVENRFSTTMETPKASVLYVFNGPMEYTLENELALNILQQTLFSRYQESIREEKGGTYGVHPSGSLFNRPLDEYIIQIFFDTDPAMVEELLPILKQEIEKIAREGLNPDDLAKAKEYMAKQHPDDLQQNTYWQGVVTQYNNEGFDSHTGYMDIVNGFTTDYFKEFAGKILADGNETLILMTPEN